MVDKFEILEKEMAKARVEFTKIFIDELKDEIQAKK